MSAEIFVLSDRQIGSMAEWRQAIEAEGFALRFSPADTCNELSGHIAVRFGNENVGFESNQGDVAEFMSRYSDVDFGHAWKFARAFRSGPDLKSNVASWIGAVTFAKVTGGKVFDPGADRLSVLEDLLNSLRVVERDILQVEDELEKLKQRPRTAANPSPAIISVRLWKEEEEGEEST